MADNENTPIVETTVDGEPGTGEQNDTTPKADSNDLADKVSMWQAMSRENEKKSHANLKRATEAENKLADVEHQYAQAQAQIAVQKALHIVDVLHTQRLIQAILFGQSLLSSGTDGLFCHERAAGDQVHDKKGNRSHNEDTEDTHCDTLDDVLCHRLMPLQSYQ